MNTLDTQSVFRLILLVWFLVNLLILAGNVLQTYDTFNPSYWRHYFQQHCLRPVLGLVVFIVLILSEDWLIHWIGA